MSKPTTTEMFTLMCRHLGFITKHERCPPSRLAFEHDETRAVLVLARNNGMSRGPTREIEASLFLEVRRTDAMGHATWLPVDQYTFTLTEKNGRIKSDLSNDNSIPMMVDIVVHLCWRELEDHLRRFWDEHQV
jgi:hypothetical protein